MLVYGFKVPFAQCVLCPHISFAVGLSDYLKVARASKKMRERACQEPANYLSLPTHSSLFLQAFKRACCQITLALFNLSPIHP